MRILQIANGYLKNKLYGHLFSNLEQLGVEETVFVPVRRGENIPEHPENVHIIPCFGQLDRVLFYKKQKQMISWLETNTEISSFDVIHAHTVFSGGYAAMQLHKRYGIPYIVAVRNTDVNTFFKYMVHLRSLGVEIMRNAEKVVFLSPAYQQTVLNKWVPARYRQEILEKSQVIPNGIAPLFLKNQPKSKQKPEKAVRLVYVGDINTNKNLDLTVKAAERLRREDLDVTITAVGSIKEEKYRKLIEETPFLTHHSRCGQEEVIQHLRDADIFVMPSHTETFGLVYAEAMSQGLPVLYTAGQGFDGHFPNGTVGYAVSDLDAQELAEKIRAVIERFETLSAACVIGARRFDWKQIAGIYADIYRELTERSGQ